MDLTHLRERIARWEDHHTDFERELDSTRELAKDIVCFANTDGGQIIFGVADDRSIVGIQDPEPLINAVDDVAYNSCEPPVTVVQETVQSDGRILVIVNVPKGDQRPYRTNDGRFYVRAGARCRQASREELLRLFQASGSLFYDESPLPRLGIDDLDLDAFERYLSSAGHEATDTDPERLLRNWGLLSDGHPTVAGLVLFGREPQRHLPFAQINAARFPGTDTSEEPSDRKDMTGRLLDVIDKAAGYLGLHLRTGHEIRDFEPEPRPELPLTALREAVVNAVAHRDYTVPGPVRLFILDDRVEIHTPGRPPNSVDEDQMRAGVHIIRNPRIYARLSDAGLVTRASTGVPRIVRLVREATGQDIEIRIGEAEVLLVIPRPRGNSLKPHHFDSLNDPVA